MEPLNTFEYDWPYLLTFLPPEDVLAQSAMEFGALTRKRNVNKASDLVRLAFAYAFCGMSLRQTAAWADTIGLAKLSDVALLNRLRRAAPWLGHLLYTKLADSALPPSTTQQYQRICIADATCISKPGSIGTDWRVHLGFDLSRLSINHIEISDAKRGESLTLFPLHAGDIILADRGYSHRVGFAHVMRSNADFLVRINWQNVPLLHPTGEPFDIITALRDLPECTPGDFPVMIAPVHKHHIPAVAARLLAIRKSESAAEEARTKVLRERSRKNDTIDPRTLETAGYFFVLTSLPQHRISAQEGLDLYRFRWQIELAFKRLKSVVNLDVLPAKDPLLACAILAAKLLAALLLDDLTTRFVDFFPWGYPLRPSATFALENTTRDL